MVTIQGSDGKRYRDFPKPLAIISISIVLFIQYGIHYSFFPQYYHPYCFLFPLLGSIIIALFIIFYNKNRMIEIDGPYLKNLKHRILSWDHGTFLSYYYYEIRSDTGGVIRFNKRIARWINVGARTDIFVVRKDGRLLVIAPKDIMGWITADPSIRFQEVKGIPDRIVADPEISL